MAAQSVFSHKELMNKNVSDKQEMLFQKVSTGMIILLSSKEEHTFKEKEF